MKTEAEIREYIRLLEIAMSWPCTCGEHGHRAECSLGQAAIMGTHMSLNWMLGDPEAEERYRRWKAEIQKAMAQRN